jgi:predicted CXXCH cytochrome family protein
MKGKTLKVIGVLALLVALGVGAATAALAYTTPHSETFTSTTDACAGCHRAHTGQAAYLLKDSSQVNLCYSCHDGTASDLNVKRGIYLGTANGTQNAGLRGGGFWAAIMDSNLSGSVTTSNTTSRHTVGGTGMTAWGSGSVGESTVGAGGITLNCGNCHNPHGNQQYRNLRLQPTGLPSWATDTNNDTSIKGTLDYTTTYNGSYYNRDLSEMTDNLTGDGWTAWCGSCHAAYIAPANSGTTASGWAAFDYRHMTDGLSAECMRCHVSHGSSATMNATSSGPNWPSGNATADWQEDTGGYGNAETEFGRLLHIDNRGVCTQCHGADLVGN